MRLSLHVHNFKEKFTIFMSFAFALHSAIEVTVHAVKVNYHCFLFGRVQERERIFTEGFLPLCLVYLLTCYALALFGLYTWIQTVKYPKFNWTHSTRIKLWWKVLFVYLGSLHLVYFKGFHHVCGTLDAPRCNSVTVRHIEFKYFKPKYVDGTHFFPQMARMSCSSTMNLLCLIFFYYINTKKGNAATVDR